ncbi:hypothetical protein [Winogradskyella schleiferi]|uniref:hypothetical protein n=1 Tax=Winogradskyella schleiferi TaxID=2686078 RepID=UPI0015BA494B|nr:hypothetical protein [Winogradskyella schleiferi]
MIQAPYGSALSFGNSSYPIENCIGLDMAIQSVSLPDRNDNLVYVLGITTMH